MRVINDYLCSDCMKCTEEYEEPEVLKMICSCGGVKHKQLAGYSYFKIDGFRSDINSEQWAKARIANSRRINEG